MPQSLDHVTLDGCIYDIPAPGPGQPSVNVTSITATSISLSWSLTSGSVVTSYKVMWQRDTSVGCSDEDEASGIINTNSISTSYVISGLEEDSLYMITVTAVNSIASVVSETVTAMTKDAGEKYCWLCSIEVNLYIVEICNCFCEIIYM